MTRVENNPFGRTIHVLLHERMMQFCQLYTPEVLAEPVVNGWLNRLYADDSTLHILVEMDQWKIIEHAVIEVTGTDNCKIIMCHQVYRDKPNKATFEEGLEYIDKLVLQTNAMCSVVFVEKHTKALEKYGYKISRVAMVKSTLQSSSNQENEE